MSVSFADLSARFGKIIGDKTKEVDSELSKLEGKAKLTSAQTTNMTRMVSELGIITQQLMNGMKTVKGCFDKINDVGRG